MNNVKKEIDNIIKTTVDKVNDVFMSANRKIQEEYPTETKRQRGVRAMVYVFENQYPEIMDDLKDSMKKTKASIMNDHAENKEQNIRATFRFPTGLKARIDMVIERAFTDEQPAFLSDEAQKLFGEQDWFAKNFPEFLIPIKY